MVIRECYNDTFRNVIHRSRAKTCGVNKKWSAWNPSHVQTFRWQFQCSTTTDSINFRKHAFAHVVKRILYSRSCKISVFDGRYLLTIVPCHGASSGCVSLVCFLTKSGICNFFKVFWSWNWFCCFPTQTVVCEQLTSTKGHIRIIWDDAFTFNLPAGVLKQLILYLKPIELICTGENTLESAIKQLLIANWELRSLLIWSFDPLEKRDKQSAPKNSLGTLLLPMPIAVFRYVVAFHTHSCWDHWVNFLTIFCWPSSHERQSWRCPDPDSETPCHSYLRECASCASLQ